MVAYFLTNQILSAPRGFLRTRGVSVSSSCWALYAGFIAGQSVNFLKIFVAVLIIFCSSVPLSTYFRLLFCFIYFLAIRIKAFAFFTNLSLFID